VSERTGKPIDAKTLRAVFRAELDRGVAVADAAVANALYNNAVHNNNVTAQIWWSKARMRWSETVGHQMLDQDGEPTAPVINYVGRAAERGVSRHATLKSLAFLLAVASCP
jgi:hypothetical protein